MKLRRATGPGWTESLGTSQTGANMSQAVRMGTKRIVSLLELLRVNCHQVGMLSLVKIHQGRSSAELNQQRSQGQRH